MHTDHHTNQKTKRLEARISLDQKELFQHAADLLGCTLTDFAITSLQEKAKQVIQEQDIMQMSRADQDAFVQAVFEPPKPNASLIKAAHRHAKKVKSS